MTNHYFRQNISGRPLFIVDGNGRRYHVGAGAWIRADLLAMVDARILRSGLGPAAKASRMPVEVRDAAQAGDEIVSGQTVKPARVAQEPAALHTAADIPVVIIASSEWRTARLRDSMGDMGERIIVERAAVDAWAAIQGLAAEHPAVAVITDDCLVAPGWLHAMDFCRVSTGADLVVPITSANAPNGIPLAGSRSQWASTRMPAMDYRDIASALSRYQPAHPAAVTWRWPCWLISATACRAHAELDIVQIAEEHGPARIADNAYVWVEERSPVDRQLSPVDASLLEQWRAIAPRYRQRAEAHRPDGFTVQLLAVDLGTWGGSNVTLRIAQELRHFGIAAQVGRLQHDGTAEQHTLGTLHHRSERDLARDFCATSGWTDGIAIATHWSTGRLIRQIVDANPGVLPLAFWQDLEHWFRDPLRPEHRFPMDRAREYVGIENRIYNARWQIDEARAEGFDLPGVDDPARSAFIPVGVDTELFHPRRRFEAPNAAPRVLAMWRPQTPRRGAPRVAALFERLHQRFGEQVELHTFGWNSGLPAYVTSHGFLTQEQVAALMRQSDVFIEASDWQGFGLPGLEAMASGCALVSTDTRGVWAYADRAVARIAHRDGSTHDVDELVEHAIGLCADPAARIDLARAARRHVEPLAWRNIAARWVVHLHRIWSAADRSDPRLDASLHHAHQHLGTA